MTALFLILFIAAAYVILGTIHLAAPTKVLPIYRFLLGRRLFTKTPPASSRSPPPTGSSLARLTSSSE